MVVHLAQTPLTGYSVAPFRPKRELLVCNIGGFGHECFRRFSDFFIFYSWTSRPFLVDYNSVHAPINKKIGSPCLITAHNRRGVFVP